jgi:pentose-5-phosphate-3-epimerase
MPTSTPARHVEVVPTVRVIDRRRLRHVTWVHVDIAGPADVATARTLADEGRHRVECHLTGREALGLLDAVAPFARRCILSGDGPEVRAGLARLRALGVSAGIGVRSIDPASLVVRLLDQADVVLFHADRSGDRLAPNTLGKVLAVREAIDTTRPATLIAVDGVGPTTAALAVAAGVDIVVVDPSFDLRAVRLALKEELALGELVRHGHRPVPTLAEAPRSATPIIPVTEVSAIAS